MTTLDGLAAPPNGSETITGVPTPPMVTEAHRRAALDAAASARTRRAEVRARLKAGDVSLSDVLADADSDVVVGRTRVAMLVTSLPGIGDARLKKILAAAGINPKRRAAGLTARQRGALLEAVDSPPR